MACIFDVAKYILEQKGELPNPVLQELCRRALRDGSASGKKLLFDERYELISSEHYPAGEICLDLYYECSNDTVSAEDLSNGDSGLLTTEEKLIVSETLNRCFDDVCEHFEKEGMFQESSQEECIQEPDNQESEEADEKYITRKFDIDETVKVSDPTVSFDMPNEPDNSEYEEDDETYTEGLISDIKKSVAEKTGPDYAQNTMALPDMAEFEQPADDFEETAPINYTYREKQHSRPPVSEKHPVQKQNVRKEAPKRKKSDNKMLLICVMTVMIVLLMILIMIISSGKHSGSGSKNDETEVTKAATLPKPVITTVTEVQTEPAEETTVPETTAEEITSTETETTTEITTEETTEPVTEPPAESVTEASESERNDGRNILADSVFMDVNRDGRVDELEVYKYDSDDYFYEIKYSDGSVSTYTFSFGDQTEMFDYIVYDHNSDTIYPASFNVKIENLDMTIRFDQINSSSKFQVENRLTSSGYEENFLLNYTPVSKDEIRQYYNNLEIMYSYRDSGGSEFHKVINELLK